EHGPDAGDDELIGRRLRRFRGHRDDGDLHTARLDLAREITRGEDRNSIDLAVRLRRVVVEDHHEPEALAPEAAVVKAGGAAIAECQGADRAPPVGPENALEPGLQARDVIADAANAELAEIRQVLAPLGRVQIEPLGQVLRGPRLHAVFLELPKAARIYG